MIPFCALHGLVVVFCITTPATSYSLDSESTSVQFCSAFMGYTWGATSFPRIFVHNFFLEAIVPRQRFEKTLEHYCFKDIVVIYLSSSKRFVLRFIALHVLKQKLQSLRLLLQSFQQSLRRELPIVNYTGSYTLRYEVDNVEITRKWRLETNFNLS